MRHLEPAASSAHFGNPQCRHRRASWLLPKPREKNRLLHRGHCQLPNRTQLIAHAANQAKPKA